MRRTIALAWIVPAAVLLLSIAGCDRYLPDVPGLSGADLTPASPLSDIATPFGTGAPGARTTPGSIAPAESPAAFGPTQYVVQPGDTLGLIAARFHVTVEAIRALNNIRGDLINVGQALNIPAPLPATDTVSTPVVTSGATTVTAATARPAPRATPGRVTYTVKRGDQLSVIAKRFGVSLAALARANGITNPNSIQPGQVLVIPTGQ
jgi:LysM repeat protein